MISLLQHCRRHTVAILALGAALASPSAWAVGTASGTIITNNAQLTYQVGSVTQNVQSNSATFKVDNVVRLTVQASDSLPTSVALGATGQVLQFTVTNTGNTAQDYALTPTQVVGGTITLGSTYTDTFNANSCQVFVETAGGTGYQAGSDTATKISNLAPDASQTVYVVCTIPSSGPANGEAAIVALTAETAEAGSCATTCALMQETVGGNTVDVDVVFGDLATALDGARNGKDIARDAYVLEAALTIVKNVTLLCDPFNGNSNPKHVPGAYVQYAITVSNGSTTNTATLTTIADTLPIGPAPANNPRLSFDPDLRTQASSCATPEILAGSGFKLNCTGGSRSCASTSQYFTGASDSDAVTVSGQSVSINGLTLLPAEGAGAYAAGALKPGESLTVRFNAIIQ